MQARRRKWIGSGAVTGSEWQHQHAAARGAEQRNFIRWGMERGGGEVLQSRWNFHEERDASLWRDMPRQKGSLVRAILNYRWPPCAWIFMCCMHRRPYRTTMLFFSLGRFFPSRENRILRTILLVQLSISRRLDLFFFFGRAKRRNVTKRILFLFFLSSFPPRGGAEWFVIRCIRECRKRFDSIFNRERLYGGVWMWWKFEE